MKTLTTLLLLAITVKLHAQKLPGVQQAGVKAPANIKIDGKANDWDNKFEANNPATELLYTMANDDKKLYLIVQTASLIVMDRIASGGIKLVIQKNGKKTDAGAPFVKFPFQEKPKRVRISFVQIRSGKTGIESVPDPESLVEREKFYELLAANNNKKLSELKWVYVGGITGVDKLLPVYNDNGIQAANATDSKKNFTWEMAIDLKLLGLQPDKAEKFSYHIVVNGEPNKFTDPFMLEPEVSSGQIKAPKTLEELSTTTDFWGEYSLVK